MDWVAVDWGTSRLRAWAMAGNQVVARAASEDGMGTLSRDGFEQALLSLVGPWLDRPIAAIACGMVGSRQGWVEAPYARLPTAPLGASAARVTTQDGRLVVHVIPGLAQSDPPDVMRGEETQIAGLLAADPVFDGVAILPGTHTKWARLSAGEVVGFRTFMTGELFALLSGQSVLRHGLGAGWDQAAFLEAAADGLARPEQVMARLFGLRAGGLLGALCPDAARSRLSGLLIGAELAGARGYWLGQRLAIIGAGRAAEAYRDALAVEGAVAEMMDAEATTLAGLAAARALLLEKTP